MATDGGSRASTGVQLLVNVISLGICYDTYVLIWNSHGWSWEILTRLHFYMKSKGVDFDLKEQWRSFGLF